MLMSLKDCSEWYNMNYFWKLWIKFWKPTFFGKHEQQLEFSNIFSISLRKIETKKGYRISSNILLNFEQKIESRIFWNSKEIWKVRTLFETPRTFFEYVNKCRKKVYFFEFVRKFCKLEHFKNCETFGRQPHFFLSRIHHTS